MTIKSITEQDILDLSKVSQEELWDRIGRNLPKNFRHSLPGKKPDYKQQAKKWMNAKRAEICEGLAKSDAVKAALTSQKSTNNVQLFAAVVDVVCLVANFDTAALLTELIIRNGLTSFCSDHF